MKSELTATEYFMAQKELERREYLKHLEKVARAGKVLAENVQRMGLHSGKQRKEWRAERDAALDTYNKAIK